MESALLPKADIRVRLLGADCVAEVGELSSGEV
jgi:hypothetical protein